MLDGDVQGLQSELETAPSLFGAEAETLPPCRSISQILKPCRRPLLLSRQANDSPSAFLHFSAFLLSQKSVYTLHLPGSLPVPRPVETIFGCFLAPFAALYLLTGLLSKGRNPRNALPVSIPDLFHLWPDLFPGNIRRRLSPQRIYV